MKSIVVYSLAVLACFLVIQSPATAQKPAIDLVSSHHRYMHPDAVSDTGYKENPPFGEAVLTRLQPDRNSRPAIEQKRKNRRQKGTSAEAHYGKGAPEDSITRTAKISYLNRKFVSMTVLFYITAFK